MFERKYGVKSLDTGSVGVEGYPYRTPLGAALRCVYFEWVEYLAGVKSRGWVVEEFVPKGSKKWNQIMGIKE